MELSRCKGVRQNLWDKKMCRLLRRDICCVASMSLFLNFGLSDVSVSWSLHSHSFYNTAKLVHETLRKLPFLCSEKPNIEPKTTRRKLEISNGSGLGVVRFTIQKPFPKVPQLIACSLTLLHTEKLRYLHYDRLWRKITSQFFKVNVAAIQEAPTTPPQKTLATK